MKKVIFLSILLVLVVAGCSQTKQDNLSLEEAKTMIVEFINTNLMQPGNEVSIKEVVEEDDLYKVVVNTTQGQEIESYMTKDGKKFFPQVIDVARVESEATNDQADNTPTEPQTAADVPKAEKASVELFVMSHCPYGTQMEKGILPVLETLGDKIDFELKFCDYAMHGETEINEQLNQYCIQKNEPEKLTAYLTCFLGEGKGDDCLTKEKINTSKLKSCVTATDQEFKITENFENNIDYRGRYPGFAIYKADTDNYGVSGSPSLVVNGTKIQSGRDASSILKTICAGFENPPEECETKLSSASPSPGFGFGTASGGSADASCE